SSSLIDFHLTENVRDAQIHSLPTRRSSDLGNWDQSMFDQQQYYFYLIDDEGNYHYYYFPMNNQSANNTSNVDNVNVSDDNNYTRSEEHTSELQSRLDLVCRHLLETQNRINL